MRRKRSFAPMPELTPLAVVQTYEELHTALRTRSDELGFTRADLDHIAGWTHGYAGKVLAPAAANPKVGDRRARRLGRKSLGEILESLGLRLIVAHDPALTARAEQLAHGREGRPDPAVTALFRRVAGNRHRKPAAEASVSISQNFPGEGEAA
jgi:hypothetical protein